MAGKPTGGEPRPCRGKIVIPRHVAIIMDGNGRWAARRRLPRHVGHLRGADAVDRVATACARLGVKELTLYAFSTENWKRPKAEVRFLMDLLRRFLLTKRAKIMQNNIRLRAIGRLQELPGRVRETLSETIEMSRRNRGMILRLALNYGGRQEILDAVAGLLDSGGQARTRRRSLTERSFRRHLYDPEMTDPDMLIRTGGETRLSNFLLWELSYAELWFTRTCWPDFGTSHLKRAFRAYARRERRFGGLPSRGDDVRRPDEA